MISGHYSHYCTVKLTVYVSEMEEDKKLDARHVIEEAMSTWLSGSFRLRNLLVYSTRPYEELSEVHERPLRAFCQRPEGKRGNRDRAVHPHLGTHHATVSLLSTAGNPSAVRVWPVILQPGPTMKPLGQMAGE